MYVYMYICMCIYIEMYTYVSFSLSDGHRTSSRPSRASSTKVVPHLSLRLTRGPTAGYDMGTVEHDSSPDQQATVQRAITQT